MNSRSQIKNAVYRSVDAVNELLPPEHALVARDDLVLMGKDGTLDSMGFVNFVVALEEELERELGRDVNIADLLNVQTDHGSDTISTIADVVNVVCARLG